MGQIYLTKILTAEFFSNAEYAETRREINISFAIFAYSALKKYSNFFTYLPYLSLAGRFYHEREISKGVSLE